MNFSRTRSCKKLIQISIVVFVLAVPILLLFHLCSEYTEILTPYTQSFDGLNWGKGVDPEIVSIHFRGERNMRGEFMGSISVTRDGIPLYVWENCKVIAYSEHEFFICPEDVDPTWVDNKPNLVRLSLQCYAVMFTDREWSSFSILLSHEQDEFHVTSIDGPWITSSADTVAEAERTTANLVVGSHWESWFN